MVIASPLIRMDIGLLVKQMHILVLPPLHKIQVFSRFTRDIRQRLTWQATDMPKVERAPRS